MFGSVAVSAKAMVAPMFGGFVPFQMSVGVHVIVSLRSFLVSSGELCVCASICFSIMISLPSCDYMRAQPGREVNRLSARQICEPERTEQRRVGKTWVSQCRSRGLRTD